MPGAARHFFRGTTVAKATIQDLLDEGFRPEQFGFATGNPVGWADPGGYLARLLADAGAWASSKIGDAAYAALAPGSYALSCTRQAEVQYSRALLFKRRVAFFDSSAHVSLQFPAYSERRGYADDANRSMLCATEAIAEAMRELGMDPASVLGGGVSTGVVESGRFAESAP